MLPPQRKFQIMIPPGLQYIDLETIISSDRLERYRTYCSQNDRQALELYRLNEDLSMGFMPILSFFEIAFRNKIDGHYMKLTRDPEWLVHCAKPGGFLDQPDSFVTQQSIIQTHGKLKSEYTHSKLVAGLTFGVWRYFFNTTQFAAAGHTLHQIFSKFTLPLINQHHSTSQFWPELEAAQLLFDLLFKVNELRNRIAHHEPICFDKKAMRPSPKYAQERLNLILLLLNKLDIPTKWIDLRVSELQLLLTNMTKTHTP